MSQQDVMNDVLRERARQDLKWGQQDHDPFCYLAVLGEEVGEANQAALELRFQAQGPASTEIYRDHYREELVQVAAVAIAMVECIDRGIWHWGDAVKTVDRLASLETET
jgi:NTP pyrophosphatase (non-canonical NTP hydrolase)